MESGVAVGSSEEQGQFRIEGNASRSFGSHVAVFFAAQNWTDGRFKTAAPPVYMVGPPVFVRGGVRLNWK
ncbi:MAG TPA: hypothetical protein VKB21_08510 [Candidatus Acidoferrum sp.]|nr:hypothetical protein [Candidatus Acidoferrum sp.]